MPTTAGIPVMRNDKIEIKPLTRVIGAEVRGVDLREPLDDATFDGVLNVRTCARR